MKNLKQILIQFVENELNKMQMKSIKGGYGAANTCFASCPLSSTGLQVDCSCESGVRCFADDNIGCGCGDSGLYEKGCDA
ncbi:hypothetical protein [Runella sp. SP2]|uniref:hypothetical protein n=1 Tax=Runella sp. SP2 TaxID=2268026 RepID=UPI00198031C3|nr:hypothetical protein [Runella sp. SP2]